MKYYVRVTENTVLLLKDSNEEPYNGLHGFYIIQVFRDKHPINKFEPGWILWDLKYSEHIHSFDTQEEAIGFAAMEFL